MLDTVQGCILFILSILHIASFLLVALAFVPALSFAAEKEYKTLNLAGALLEEGVDAKLGNYKEIWLLN